MRKDPVVKISDGESCKILNWNQGEIGLLPDIFVKKVKIKISSRYIKLQEKKSPYTPPIAYQAYSMVSKYSVFMYGATLDKSLLGGGSTLAHGQNCGIPYIADETSFDPAFREI